MADDAAGGAAGPGRRGCRPSARDVFSSCPRASAPPPLGSRIAARGYAGRSPGYANRQPVPPGPWRLRVKSRRLLDGRGRSGRPRPGRGGPAWRGRGGLARSGRAARADGRAPGEGRPGPALVRALVLGDPSALPPSWLRGLRRTGLSHLLAVSGLHVGLVAAIALLAAFRLGPRGRILAALAAVAALPPVAGPRPALIRASLMAFAAGTAFLAGRLPSAGNALALVAALLVLVRPELVTDLGFGLTVTATAGLVFLAPAFARAWGGGGERRGAGGSAGLAPERPGRHRRRPARLGAAGAARLPPPGPRLAAAQPGGGAVDRGRPRRRSPVERRWRWPSRRSPPRPSPSSTCVAAPFGWPAAGPPQAWGTVALAAHCRSLPPGRRRLACAPRPPTPARRLGLAALSLALAAVGWGSARRRRRPAPKTASS